MAIVALTGWSQQQRASARDAGFDHHLLKPVDLGSLLAVLRDLRR